jgi:hypothetical protein
VNREQAFQANRAKEPSLFRLSGKKGGTVRAIVRPLSGENFQRTRALSRKMFN